VLNNGIAFNRKTASSISCESYIGNRPLQRAKAEIEKNSMMDALAISLPQTEPILHFSKF